MALLAAACGQGFVTAIFLALALPRSGRAWGTERDLPSSGGYRSLQLVSVLVPRVPTRLLGPAFLTIVLGLGGAWTFLAPWSPSFRDADDWLTHLLGVELLGCAGLAIAVLVRGRLAAHAPALGVMATTLGCLVSLPALAWPRWFHTSSFALPWLLGLASIGAGLSLLWLVARARLADMQKLERDLRAA